MITENSRLKCDGCGKILRWNELHVNYVPDTPFNEEIVEHFHPACSPVVKDFKCKIEQVLSREIARTFTT